MKLYTFPPSPNGRKVQAVINHLGLKDIEVHVVNLGEGAQRKPEYLTVNPMGRIPALVDGDLTLWESNAIAQYLCDRQGDTGLFPRDARVRADISRWLFWEASDWQRAAAAMAFENFVKGLFGWGAPDPAKVKEGEERFHGLAKVLDAHLNGRKFIVGNGVTLADFSIASMLTYAAQGKFPVAEYKHILAWNAGLNEVPAWRSTAPQQRPAS